MAVVVAAGDRLAVVSKFPAKRWFLLLPFIFFALPWAEWLDVTTANLREPWSRQIFLQAIALYAAILILHALPAFRKSLQEAIHDFLQIACSGTRIFAWPLLFFVASCLISIFVFRETPFLQDSAAHLFQGKVFLAGRLAAPQPTAPEFFSVSGDMLVMQHGRWFSMYQPGFPLLLAGAMFLSAEWLLCPFLGAATILVWVLYARRWYGAKTAGLFAVIAVTSPFLLIMSSTMMVYTPELFFVSLVLFLSRLLMEEENLWAYGLLFTCLVFVMNVRAFSSGIFLAPVLLYIVLNQFRHRSYRLPIVIFTGIIVGGALLLYYQSQTTGHPLRTGYSLEFPDLQLGFEDSGYGHTPLRGLANVSNNLLGLNSWLTGWFSGSLLFVLLFLLLTPKVQVWDQVLLVGCAMVISFYFFHYFQDLILGPRYYYVFAPLLLLFIARSAFLETRFEFSAYGLPLIGIFVVTAVFFRLPQAIQQYQIERTYPGNFQRELDLSRTEKLLVFLDRTVRPYFVNYNDPFLGSHAIICLDRGRDNSRIMQAFPQHRVVYFRSEIAMFGKGEMRPGYRFFDTPNLNPPGFISMNHLAIAIQNAGGFVDQDFLHIAYSDVLNSENASEQLLFLEERFNTPSHPGKRPYARSFEMGLLHIARFLLIPKASYDADRSGWEGRVDWNRIRSDFKQAERNFVLAGEIGKPILPALERAKKGIDIDQDETLSDQELAEFFAARLSISNN